MVCFPLVSYDVGVSQACAGVEAWDIVGVGREALERGYTS